MRSTLTRYLCCLSSVGLFSGMATTANACHRCQSFGAHVAAVPYWVQDQAMEHRVQIDARVTEVSRTWVVPAGSAILVLNCPAETRCTIDGRVTHASGANRQYHITFDGEIHQCRIELRLRDNDEEVTYDFDHPLEFKNGQRTVLTVTQKQMTKTYDKQRSRILGDLFAPGTTLRVTSDKKLEVVDTVSATQTDSEAKPSSVAAKVDHKSPLWRTRAHQSKVLDKEIDAEKRLAKQAAEKATSWEAAHRSHQRAEDAFQVKHVEVDLAANDSATVRAAKRLEAKHLETEVARTRDVAVQAKAELDAAKHEHQEALTRVSGSKRALELTEQKIIVEHLKNGIAQEQAEHQRLRDLVQRLSEQLNDAGRILGKVTKAREAQPVDTSKAELELASEFKQQVEQKLNEARQEFEQATKRIQQQEKELEGFLNGTIHVDLP